MPWDILISYISPEHLKMYMEYRRASGEKNNRPTGYNPFGLRYASMEPESLFHYTYCILFFPILCCFLFQFINPF